MGWIRRAVALLAILGMVAAGAFVVRQRWVQANASAQPLYATAHVIRGSIQADVSGSATLKPAQSVTLSSPAPGKVDQVSVHQGDSVKAGQVIAVVQDPQLAQSITQRSLRPLREMTLVADRVAGGDLSARAGQAHAPEEVSRLASAFDSMVDRLASAIGEERATHQQMRQFLDDASHELRTPLTALSGTLEVLQGDAGSDLHAVREGLRSAYRQSRRLGGLVSGLLALARAERPEGLPLEAADLHAVLAAVRPTAERLAADHHLQWEVPGTALPVLANADVLGGALLSILDNAVRYSPLGTPIRVRVERDGDGAEVTVTDHGIGIAAESLPYVFDRFYRCPPSAAMPAPVGTGLGLAIVRSVMERHHGAATIESTTGQGTTVRLRLPLLTETVHSADG